MKPTSVKRPPTIEQRDELEKMLNNGDQVEKCALYFGCSSNTITNRAGLWGIDLPDRPIHRLTKEEKLACASLAEESSNEFAGLEYGVSASAVRKYREQADIGHFDSAKNTIPCSAPSNPLCMAWV